MESPFKQLRWGDYDEATLRVIGTWYRGSTRADVPAHLTNGDHLRELFIEYAHFCELNPLYGSTTVRAGVVPVPKKRVMTLRGFCIYIGRSSGWLTGLRRKCIDGGDPHGLLDVIDWIVDVIDNDKYEGGAAGLLNATMISKDLGLSESSSLRVSIEEVPKLPEIHVISGVRGYLATSEEEEIEDIKGEGDGELF